MYGISSSESRREAISHCSTSSGAQFCIFFIVFGGKSRLLAHQFNIEYKIDEFQQTCSDNFLSLIREYYIWCRESTQKRALSLSYLSTNTPIDIASLTHQCSHLMEFRTPHWRTKERKRFWVTREWWR